MEATGLLSFRVPTKTSARRSMQALTCLLQVLITHGERVMLHTCKLPNSLLQPENSVGPQMHARTAHLLAKYSCRRHNISSTRPKVMAKHHASVLQDRPPRVQIVIDRLEDVSPVHEHCIHLSSTSERNDCMEGATAPQLHLSAGGSEPVHLSGDSLEQSGSVVVICERAPVHAIRVHTKISHAAVAEESQCKGAVVDTNLHKQLVWHHSHLTQGIEHHTHTVCHDAPLERHGGQG
mmetsp:Transcript_122161/g.390704  ORF Transcript_122161/g.390704 Transcript_122161/m.390704 type:complete len:236 (+) Transcript_122161:29-736(+)